MRWMLLVLTLCVAGCGYSSRENELTGQAKKAVHNTPVLCPDYTVVDISLGVMRGGVGSMSTQDVWVVVPSRETAALAVLKKAVDEGGIVKVKYDELRVAICTEDYIVTAAEAIP